jgi:hypothetical protein
VNRTLATLLGQASSKPPNADVEQRLLLGVHVRVQDSTHQTHAAARGRASLAKLETSVFRCAENRIVHAAAEALHQRSARANAGIAVFVASDHHGVRQRLVERLRGVRGVRTAMWYDPPAAAFEGDTASRTTVAGQIAAAVELAILGRADHLLQSGNHGFSSYSATAAGFSVGLRSQFIVSHPCDEIVRMQSTSDSFPDCLEQLHPQPWLNLRWPDQDTPFERRRVSCPLHASNGTRQPLVRRLESKKAMELICPDLLDMASAEKRMRLASADRTDGAPSRRARDEL